MASYDPKHHRQSTRLRGYDYSQPGAYFITICTYQHQSLFGAVVEGDIVLNSSGQVVLEEWFKTAQIRSKVELFEDEFVVMPNHVHGIIWIVDEPYVGATQRVAPTTDDLHRRVAPTITRVIPKLLCNIPASVSQPIGPKPGSIGAIIGQFKSIVTKRINLLQETHGVPVWQRNYHDHIIRDETELNNLRAYIADNPRRWTEDRYHIESIGG